VLPAFRPDKALAVLDPPRSTPGGPTAAASNTDIGSFSAFLDALRARHDFFHAHGCRLSDHGMSQCHADFAQKVAADIRESASQSNRALEEHGKFAAFLMLLFDSSMRKRAGSKASPALRNSSTRLPKRIGPDTGFDSIGDVPQAAALASYLDRLDQENTLPKTIIYNSDPSDNDLFATMAGNFQDGTMPGKIQFGSGWWHLDQYDGMTKQLESLSNMGLLSRFVGMITDSRSFLSYTRHEYFRRLLCNIVGGEIERGILPSDIRLSGEMIRNICYSNAERYFNLSGRVGKPESASNDTQRVRGRKDRSEVAAGKR
jgi:glucuronate isomerase